MGLDELQVFEAIFSLLGFRDWKGAAAYYIALIQEFPTKFTKIEDHAKNYSVGSRALINGRNELINKGILAEVLKTDSKENLGREMFIPINPMMIWENNQDQLRNVFIPESIQMRGKIIEKFNELFKNKFKKYGLFITEGYITAYYDAKWPLNFLSGSNFLEGDVLKNAELLMAIGRNSFHPSLLLYYKKMLSQVKKMNILIDIKNEEILNNAEQLKDEKLAIRHLEIRPLTSRRFVCNSVAIDGRKLLSDDQEISSYVGTIYLQKDCINILKSNFESLWEIGKEFEKDQ